MIRLETSNYKKGVMVSLGVSMLGVTDPVFVAPNVKIDGTYYKDQVLEGLVYQPDLSQF